MPKKKGTFIVLSPDGYPIDADKEYQNGEEVKQAMESFANKYRAQGYYSQTIVQHIKIPVDKITDHCRIVSL